MAADGTFKLGYDLSQLEADGHRAALMARQHGAQIAKQHAAAAAQSAAAMRSFGSQIMGVAGLPLGIGATVMGLKTMAERFDNLEDSASAMNASVEGMQRLQYMAAGTVTPLDQMQRGLLHIKRALFEVDSESKQKALASIGLDAARFMSLDADQAFIELARGFQTAQRDGRGFAEVYELLKKTTPELIPALRTSADELQRMGDHAVVSAESIALFTVNLGKLKTAGIEATNLAVGAMEKYSKVNAMLAGGLASLIMGENPLLGMFQAVDEIESEERASNEERKRMREELSRKESEEAEKRKAIIESERRAKEASDAARKSAADRKAVESVTSTEQDVRIKELRAAGRTGEADKLERLQKGQKEFQRLRDANPEMGEAWALQMAHRKDEAEHRRPGTIRGYKGQNSKPGAGLDWIYGHNRDRGGQSLATSFKFQGLDEMTRVLSRIEKHLEEK